jgi:arginine deiminase
VAQVVIVCEPEGSSLMMGGLHPRGSLYERPVNIDLARAHHANFRQVLREHGVRVLTVREILSHGVDQHVGARVQLEGLAMSALKYQVRFLSSLVVVRVPVFACMCSITTACG